MVVLLAAGAFGEADYTTDLADVGLTITAAMASLATGTDQVAGGGGQGAGQAFNSLFFLGLLLFLVTMLLNVVGDFFVRRDPRAVLMAAADVAIAQQITVDALAARASASTSAGTRVPGDCCSCRSSSCLAIIVILLGTVLSDGLPACSRTAAS